MSDAIREAARAFLDRLDKDTQPSYYRAHRVALRAALLANDGKAVEIETAARHAAQCVEYERRPVKSHAMDVDLVERAVASAMREIDHVARGGVSLAAKRAAKGGGK